MSLTFKQYHAFLEAPLDEAEQINEIWPFKNQEEKEKAERQKLELLAKKGDLKAKAKLAAQEKAAQLATTAKTNAEQEKEKRFAQAKASSVHNSQAPRWSRELNKWVKPGDDTWGHVGKHH